MLYTVMMDRLKLSGRKYKNYPREALSEGCRWFLLGGWDCLIWEQLENYYGW